MLKPGQSFTNKNGFRFKVIELCSTRTAIVKFESGYSVEAQRSHIVKGLVRDRYAPIVFGVGFTGVGVYSKPTHTKLYNMWKNMLQRCYTPVRSVTNKAYIGCTVVKRWYNFQNFCADIIKMPNWNTPRFELDKDLRVLGNKKYGPKYCSFVPNRINAILIGQHTKHGVTKTTKGTYFVKGNDRKYLGLGTYNTKKEAVAAFIKHKLALIKAELKKWKFHLHREVYSTLSNIDERYFLRK